MGTKRIVFLTVTEDRWFRNVMDANVEMTDSTGGQHTAVTNREGRVIFRDVPIGVATVHVTEGEREKEQRITVFKDPNQANSFIIEI